MVLRENPLILFSRFFIMTSAHPMSFLKVAMIFKNFKFSVASCWKRGWGGCDRWLTQAIRSSSPPPLLPSSSPPLLLSSPVLVIYVPPSALVAWAISRTHPWESQVCWDHLDWICDWTLLRPLYKLLRFWRAGVEIESSCGAQTSLLGNSLAA